MEASENLERQVEEGVSVEGGTVSRSEPKRNRVTNNGLFGVGVVDRAICSSTCD